jgi:cytochrome c-type biogenesis protein CcmH/NrfG
MAAHTDTQQQFEADFELAMDLAANKQFDEAILAFRRLLRVVDERTRTRTMTRKRNKNNDKQNDNKNEA